MEKFALAKQKMRNLFLVCLGITSGLAALKCASHPEALAFLVELLPVVLILVASLRSQQLLRNLESQAAPAE